MVRRKLKRSLYLHGISRHSEADRMELAKGDFAAMAALLGDKPTFSATRRMEPTRPSSPSRRE